MTRPQIIICLLLSFSISLFSQDDLGDDLTFFEKKANLYQHWLEAKGLGDWIKVDSVRLQDEDKELEIILSFHTTYDTDTAALYWSEMVRNFAKKNRDQQLHAVLFQTYTRMMEVAPANCNLQLYVPDQGIQPYDTCFYIWVWEENDMIQTESKTFGCLRAQPLNISIDMASIQSVKAEETMKLPGKKLASETFDHILAYAKKRYVKPNCDNRNQRIEDGDIEQSDYQLRFAVTDLCQEVLTDEKKSTWCKIVELWGGTCNDTRRERLEFTFNFIPTHEGYSLTGSLTGKFGSGVYEPRRSGYMDMEPDFEEDYLIPYVRAFQKDLKKYLEGRP